MLSVRIYAVAGGRTESFSCGKPFDCPDRRDDFYIQNIADKIMESIAFANDGCRYTLYKVNGGRGDASEACIFIPKGTNTADTPLKTLIEKLRGIMLRGKTELEDEQVLSELCSQQGTLIRTIVPSIGGSFASLAYGEGTGLTFDAILNDLFRPEFNQKKRIFLYDVQSNVRYSQVSQIRPEQLRPRQIVELRPPQGAKKGFIPYIDGDKFVQKQILHEGTPFVLEWRRKYWRPIEINVKTNMGLTNRDLLPLPTQYKRTKDNPLNRLIRISIVVAVLAILTFVVVRIVKGKNEQAEYEKAFYNKVISLDFATIEEQSLRDHDMNVWIDIMARAKKLTKFYDFKLQSDGDVVTRENLEDFVNKVEAAAYIDSHTIWKKDEMEDIELLKGLYDYVNKYGFMLQPNEGSNWKDLLAGKGLGKFDKLISLKQRGLLDGTFTKGNTLDVEAYIRKIEYVPEMVTTPTANTSKPRTRTSPANGGSPVQTKSESSNRKKKMQTS